MIKATLSIDIKQRESGVTKMERERREEVRGESKYVTDVETERERDVLLE